MCSPVLEDTAFTEADHTSTGILAPYAIKVIMKILCCARVCRLDLMHPVCTLSRDTSKRSRACDKRLHRLTAYIHTTRDWTLRTCVGDAADKCRIACFSDADFAGDLKDSKSTSGGFVAVVGPKMFVPLSCLCKKQQVVSHSSTESEIVALDVWIRTEALPTLTLWETLLGLVAADSRTAGGHRGQVAPTSPSSAVRSRPQQSTARSGDDSGFLLAKSGGDSGFADTNDDNNFVPAKVS